MPRWATIGKTGDKCAEKALNMLEKWGPYRAQRKDGNISFAVSFSRRGTCPLIQRSTWMDERKIDSFVLSDYEASPGIKQIDRFAITPEQYTSLEKLANDRDGIKCLEILCRILFYSALPQQEYALKEIVAPKFFHDFPGGRILFITASPTLNMALAALRMIGAAIDLADRDVGEFERLPPLRLLSGAQNAGIFYPGKQLTIPLALFLPRLHGFVADKIALAYLFLFDNPMDDVRSLYPRSGLEFIRSESSGLFRQQINLDVSEVMHKAVDRFCLIQQGFSVDEISHFIDQYLSKLDDFMRFLIDPSNFSNQDTSDWIALSHYRAWLCFERIADEVILMLTDDTSYLRKTALFRILDQLASLGSENGREQVELFKDFLVPSSGCDPISEGLAEYQGEVAHHLSDLLRSARSEIMQVGLDSVYLVDRVDPVAGQVTLLDSTQLSSREFVVNMIRELRNTYHGYYTNRFDQYLVISTGDTPESITIVGALAYLGFIARPDLFVRRAW